MDKTWEAQINYFAKQHRNEATLIQWANSLHISNHPSVQRRLAEIRHQMVSLLYKFK